VSQAPTALTSQAQLRAHVLEAQSRAEGSLRACELDWEAWITLHGLQASASAEAPAAKSLASAQACVAGDAMFMVGCHRNSLLRFLCGEASGCT
jgi:hypothetical protein